MLDRVERIIGAYEARPTALIMILQEVQDEYRYLPREAMEIIGRRMDLALSQIYGVATFYKAFSLEPRGRHHVCVCTGTACHVRNSRSIVEKLERDLKITQGPDDTGREFTLETVNCVGRLRPGAHRHRGRQVLGPPDGRGCGPDDGQRDGERRARTVVSADESRSEDMIRISDARGSREATGRG